MLFQHQKRQNYIGYKEASLNTSLENAPLHKQEGVFATTELLVPGSTFSSDI